MSAMTHHRRRRRRLGATLHHLAGGAGGARTSLNATAGDSQAEEGGGAAVVALRGSPHFGAEITGLDIRERLRAGWSQGHEDGGAEYLDALVATHGLLLFRNQLPRLSAAVCNLSPPSPPLSYECARACVSYNASVCVMCAGVGHLQQVVRLRASA